MVTKGCYMFYQYNAININVCDCIAIHHLIQYSYEGCSEIIETLCLIIESYGACLGTPTKSWDILKLYTSFIKVTTFCEAIVMFCFKYETRE